MITESACGKVILYGEHAVVYGKPAIAVPVKNLRMEVSVEKSATLQIKSECFENLDWIKTGIVKICDELDVDSNFSITIKSTIPIASGMGSSAALSVAATKAIAKLKGVSLDKEAVRKVSYASENIFHGGASGVDNAVISYECPIYYIKHEEIEELEAALDLKIVVIDSKVRSSTANAVAAVRQKHKENKEKVNAIFDDIENTVNSAKFALEAGDFEELGNLMNLNQDALELLGLSVLETTQIINECKKLGCFGAKISGAGLGGNVISIFPDDKFENAKSELSKKYNVVIVKL